VRLSINYGQCQGHGRCYALAPDLFEADDNGTGVVRVEQVDLRDEPAARRAQGACPENAIRISDDG
jgi:ferredoxin